MSGRLSLHEDSRDRRRNRVVIDQRRRAQDTVISIASARVHFSVILEVDRS